MARKQHKYHYIYRTTCSITGKYYVGMHSAVKLNDGYLGSGKVLRRSIRKYGKENHTFEILQFCDSREDLPTKEAEIVNEQLLTDPLCMNLRLGGSGNNGGFMSSGWKMPPMTDEHRRNMIIARNNRPPVSDETRKKMSDSHKGKVRTDEHKRNNAEAVKKSEKFQTKMKSADHRKIMSARTKEVHEKRKAAGIPNKGGWCKPKSDNSDTPE